MYTHQTICQDKKCFLTLQFFVVVLQFGTNTYLLILKLRSKKYSPRIYKCNWRNMDSQFVKIWFKETVSRKTFTFFWKVYISVIRHCYAWRSKMRLVSKTRDLYINECHFEKSRRFDRGSKKCKSSARTMVSWHCPFLNQLLLLHIVLWTLEILTSSFNILVR